ncbi:MAG TPA: FecR domain-containing protein, partial [Polyangiales bacterium]|nr:FecR domain-containing protein [Polyangiales bacterium]
ACTRWEVLSDREALGEAMRDEEQHFLREHGASCPACGAEQGVWDGFATMLDARAAPVHMSPRKRSWLAYAAAAALMFLGVSERQPPTPRTYEAHALADLEVNGQLASQGSTIALGSVVVARRAGACMSLEPAVKVCLDEGSLLRVSELGAERRRLELLKGKLTAELDAQPAGSSFGVLTRDGSAVAIGTAFAVEVPAQGPVITRVLHGTVLVRTNAGREQRVGAHGVVAMNDTPRASEAAAEPREQEPAEARVELTVQEAPAVTAPAVSVTQWLLLARERRARGDDRGALAAYRSLFSLGAQGPETRSALIPYGELLLAKGRARPALAAFERYLVQPGALSEEASFGRLRALRALGDRGEERAATEAFLRDYAGSPLAAGLRAP